MNGLDRWHRWPIKFGLVLGMLSNVGAAGADEQEGVLIRCGASKGEAYYFADDLLNPDGPNWTEDGSSTGKILLVRLGDEWDIQFNDAIGTSGYRQDGAKVFPLTSSDTFLMIGAFHENYSDIYTFDIINNEVAWTSSKIGPIIAKSAVYRADCD